MLRSLRLAAAVLAPALAAAAAPAASAAPERTGNADFLWFGGTIFAGPSARPEALAVKDGRIVALGTRADLEKAWKGKGTLPIDLNGQALVAGLVTPPLLSARTAPPARPASATPPVRAARIERPKPMPTPAPRRTPAPTPAPRAPAPPLEALAADVSPPPGGLPYTIASVRDALRMWTLRSSFPKRHRVVVGFGYDETKLEEKRPPTREELDRVSATLPVIVVSHAGDAGAYNTIALQKAGISWRSQDPPGGAIRRRGRIHEPNGVLEGAAHAAAFAKLVPRLDEKERARLYAESVRMNAPEAPEAVAALEAPDAASPATAPALAAVLPPPAPAPTPAPAPEPAPAAAAALPIPASPRDAESAPLAALVADALAGRTALEAGRPADMSVLSRDPSATDASARRLEVVEEVRKGRTVWRRDPTRR